MSKEYTEFYTRWRKLSKESPTLAHQSHKPDHNQFGLSEWEARQIEKLVDREMERSLK